MNKEIKLLAYYDDETNLAENRLVSPAANNKLKYIIDVLKRLETRTEIISPCVTQKKQVFPGKEIQLNQFVKLKLFKTRGSSILIIKKIQNALTMIRCFLYIKKASSCDTVLVYHSLYLMPIVRILKRKHCHIVLEVEEIYGDVKNNRKTKQKELRFFECAEAYIFPTHLLETIINTQNKPSVIIHGTYQVEQDRNIRLFDKEHIHCVYAGTFYPRKGGCAAAAAAAFLPANYHMHIIGFGSEQEISNMKQMISEISQKSDATVTFDGLKSGEEYIQFIQSCEIGLSTQNPDAAFNATSFPSKILSYLSNGLRVVSIRIPAIEQSAVGDMISYYDKQTPEEIAKAILSIDLSKTYCSRKRIEELSRKFIDDFNRMLGDL